MKNKAVDTVCLCLVGVLFVSVVLFNLIQPNRPTESEMEKRELAKMPAFSVEALADGSYFAGLSTFVSDTFVARDSLVSMSRKLDTLKGVKYSLDGGSGFVVLDGNTGAKPVEEENEDAADKIAAAFESLENKTEDISTAPISQADTPSAADLEPTENTAELELQTDVTEPAELQTEQNEQSKQAEQSDQTENTSDDTGVNDGNGENVSPDPSNENPDTQIPAVVEEKPEETKVTAIHLSKSSLKLTVGSGAAVNATVESNSPTGVNVKWSVSDKNIASIAMNPAGGIDVKGVAEGKCTLSCSWGEGEYKIRQSCEVTVTSITASAPSADENLHADFLTDGMFIYGDAVYTQAFYSQTNATYYAQTAEYYKKLFGDKTRVNVIVAPVSSMVVDNEEVKAKIPDQKDILDKMGALMPDSVNFVDAYSEMYDHRNEYLFFKSDHHWTARGAYYAYSAFAKSIGLEPTPIEGFDYGIRNESYSGSMYSYTYDARVKSFTDTIEAFYPKKKHTMTVSGSNGATYNYDTCIVNTNSTYVTFIAGDNPYTVINVPDNPQDMNVLVLKDSFGNAFIPFLCEHYGNIIVVDTRYSTLNLYDQLGDYGLTDIIFVNNIQAANSFTWSKMYLGAVGVNLN